MTAFLIISSAGLAQVTGAQCSFQPSVKASMAAVRSLTLVKVPRRMAWRVMIPKKISTDDEYRSTTLGATALRHRPDGSESRLGVESAVAYEPTRRESPPVQVEDPVIGPRGATDGIFAGEAAVADDDPSVVSGQGQGADCHSFSVDRVAGVEAVELSKPTGVPGVHGSFQRRRRRAVTTLSLGDDDSMRTETGSLRGEHANSPGVRGVEWAVMAQIGVRRPDDRSALRGG